MSNWYGFYILPFDWRVPSPSEMELPIDVADFAEQLQKQCPCGEIVVVNPDDDPEVRLYITTDWGDPWVSASLQLKQWTILEVSAYPRALALQLLLWYRSYIGLDKPLFILVVGTAEGLELTEDTSYDDIERLYPSAWIVQPWKGC